LHDRIILQRGEVFVNKSSLNKRWRTPKEQPKMDNPEKLAMATYGTQEKDEKNKNTTQNVLDTTNGTIHKQSQITLIRHESSYDWG
jgi:hypothetical protein